MILSIATLICSLVTTASMNCVICFFAQKKNSVKIVPVEDLELKLNLIKRHDELMEIAVAIKDRMFILKNKLEHTNDPIIQQRIISKIEELVEMFNDIEHMILRIRELF